MSKSKKELATLQSKSELALQSDFNEVLAIIQNARKRAYSAVNDEHINMCRLVGEYVSHKVKEGTWGEGTINQLSDFLQTQVPNKSGYSPRNLRRMRQFYEVYKVDHEFWSPLVTKLDWTQNIIIMSLDTKEERMFALTWKINTDREIIRTGIPVYV